MDGRLRVAGTSRHAQRHRSATKPRVMALHWHLIDEQDVVSLIADHAAQRRLCRTLEAIADALPDLPSAELSLRTGQQLSRYSHRKSPMEDELFQRLVDDAPCPTVGRIFNQIRQHRAIDMLHADDLAIELDHLSGLHRAEHPGQLAYMLRCFFDGCRRAVAFEELALLKLAGERLTSAARAAIVASFGSQ